MDKCVSPWRLPRSSASGSLATRPLAMHRWCIKPQPLRYFPRWPKLPPPASSHARWSTRLMRSRLTVTCVALRLVPNHCPLDWATPSQYPSWLVCFLTRNRRPFSTRSLVGTVPVKTRRASKKTLVATQILFYFQKTTLTTSSRVTAAPAYSLVTEVTCRAVNTTITTKRWNIVVMVLVHRQVRSLMLT